MKPKDVDGFNRVAVQQFAHEMINKWIDQRNVQMRPGDKKALLQTMIQAIPCFLDAKESTAFQDYIEMIRREERQFCVDVIVSMEEPVPGLVNKQLALNSCTYQPK